MSSNTLLSHSDILITPPSAEYELVDSGEGEKLERFGQITLSRPDPQALWRKQRPELWKKADAVFTREEKKGEWQLKKDMPVRWEIALAGLKLWIKPTAFKHVGLFPEQSVNWDWMRGLIEMRLKKSAQSAVAAVDGLEVLNLFGYTGGATLACAQAGAKVVHVDGSKAALAWARDNAEASGLSAKPVRWILDDARTFVSRELKRGRTYDAIIMDPPAFGHGPDNELWKIEEHVLPLIEQCAKLLKPTPLFFLVNGYAAGYSATAYGNIIASLVASYGGSLSVGELAIRESGIAQDPSITKTSGIAGRLLPCGIFARWSADTKK